MELLMGLLLVGVSHKIDFLSDEVIYSYDKVCQNNFRRLGGQAHKDVGSSVETSWTVWCDSSNGTNGGREWRAFDEANSFGFGEGKWWAFGEDNEVYVGATNGGPMAELLVRRTVWPMVGLVMWVLDLGMDSFFGWALVGCFWRNCWECWWDCS